MGQQGLSSSISLPRLSAIANSSADGFLGSRLARVVHGRTFSRLTLYGSRENRMPLSTSLQRPTAKTPFDCWTLHPRSQPLCLPTTIYLFQSGELIQPIWPTTGIRPRWPFSTHSKATNSGRSTLCHTTNRVPQCLVDVDRSNS